MSTSPAPAVSRSSSNQPDPPDGPEIDDAEESNDPNWYWTRYETDDGEYYYFNRKTHETTWKRPLTQGEAKNQKVWCKACSKECDKSYYNASTGQFEDGKPSGIELGNFLNAIPKVKVDFKSVATSSSTSSSTSSTPSSSTSSTPSFSKTFTIISGKDFQDQGQDITIGSTTYSARCLILSLAYVLNIKPDDFYQQIISAYNSQKLTLDQKNLLDNDLIDSTVIKGTLPQTQAGLNYQQDNYIDADKFFTYFLIYKINQTGLIVTPPMTDTGNNWSLTIQDIKSGSRPKSQGFFIKPINSDGTVGDITTNTPIIYNQGMSHFVPGTKGNPISQDLLDSFNISSQDNQRLRNITFTFNDAPIKVVEGNPDRDPVINDAVLKTGLGTNVNCMFKERDQIEINGKAYTVLDRKTTNGACENYTLINNVQPYFIYQDIPAVQVESGKNSGKWTYQQILDHFLPSPQNKVQLLATLPPTGNAEIKSVLSVNMKPNPTVIGQLSGGRKKSRRNRNKTKKSKKTRRSKKN